MTKHITEIYLAGGCFWGTEKYFSLLHGVLQTNSGYANGVSENPTYEQVCRGNTGYAETVKIVYNADIISLPFILDMYYDIIDPVSVNRQGNDIGTQYRTGIYYTNPVEKETIEASIAKLQKKYIQPIAIEVMPLTSYYPAEEYHQAYLKKNPGGYCHIGTASFQKAQHAVINEDVREAKTQNKMKAALTPMQYRVTQENATEPAFHNEFYNTFEPGVYVDITTGEPLFSSEDKFDSGCGWPAFSKPLKPELLTEITDTSHGMTRTEIRSKTGNAHLGHVFNDGPQEKGGLRYCINSASLRFIPKEE